MGEPRALQRGRDAYGQRAWADAYERLTAADREHSLSPEDLESLATAAYLVCRDDESEAAGARAHQIYVERQDWEGAARSAFWLAFGLLQRGAHAPAAGWLARAERLLDDAHIECVVRGYLRVAFATRRVIEGDPTGGHTAFSQAAAIATRF